MSAGCTGDRGLSKCGTRPHIPCAVEGKQRPFGCGTDTTSSEGSVPPAIGRLGQIGQPPHPRVRPFSTTNTGSGGGLHGLSRIWASGRASIAPGLRAQRLALRLRLAACLSELGSSATSSRGGLRAGRDRWPRRHCPPHSGGEAPFRAAGPGAARSDGSLFGSGWKRSEFTEHCLHAGRERLDVPRSVSLRHLPYRLPGGIRACPGVGLELLRVGSEHLVER